MYEINFKQQSNCTTWLETIRLVAADDLSPIGNDDIEIQLQVWARSSRGAGDQSQLGGWNIFQAVNNNYIPVVNASTKDGTGRLTLDEGDLLINLDFPNQANVLPGYYEIGMIMFRDGISEQLLVGTLPLYNGGVFSQFPFGGLR